MEVVETGRRRRFSDAEKLRIVEESFTGHRQASATARRHGISNALLFRWRRAYRAGQLGAAPVRPTFVQATVVDAPQAAEHCTDGGGAMEIRLPNGRRVTVGPDVDAEALGRVLAVLEGR